MNPIIPPRAEAKREAAEQIRREISARFEGERQHANLWRRVCIWIEIEREVAAEVKRRFPPSALFAKA